MFRHYDPKSGVFSYRGENFDIPIIARAMMDVLDKAKVALAAQESSASGPF